MLVKRLLVTIILLPVGMALIVVGGIPYTILIAVILGLAAWEYSRLLHVGGLMPASILVAGGAALIALARVLGGADTISWVASLLILLSMTYHLLAYERGRDQAGTDFGLTLGGMFYLGWIGAYLILLRTLPEGKWWLLVVLPAVWFADSGAYFIGSRFGRHKMSPRLSPKKSWEGYLAGLLTGTLGGALLASLWRTGAGPATAITPARGALLGFLLAVLTPLGDLGVSMIKRQVGAKDSGNLLPGHGGVFDRIDTWLWAGVIGYYTIIWLFTG